MPKGAPTIPRSRIDDDALDAKVRALTSGEHALTRLQAIVDHIRSEGFSASLPRVEASLTRVGVTLSPSARNAPAKAQNATKKSPGAKARETKKAAAKMVTPIPKKATAAKESTKKS